MKICLKQFSSMLIGAVICVTSITVATATGNNGNKGRAIALSRVPISLFSNQASPQTPRKYGISSIRGDLNIQGLALGVPVLSIDLPNGKIINLENKDIDRRGAGDIAWRGMVVGNDDSDVSLTLKNGLVFGRLRDGDDTFEFSSDIDGTLTIEQIDTSAMPACDTNGTHINSAGDAVAASEGAIPASEGDAGVLIDLLVVYSTDALADAGSVAQIETMAQAAVDAANAAFVNSNMTARYRLVHTAAVNHTTIGNTSDDLDWVTNDSGVAALRDQYGADMVTILVDTPNSCGTAWIQRSPGPGFEDAAFAATDVDCAVGNLTFAHEHGHNMGFEHNSEDSSATTSDASYPWSFGQHVDGSYRTVMSYGESVRVTQFSNPDILYYGVATGLVDVRDNARTGDSTAPIVQDFRATVVPTVNPVTFAAIGDHGDGSIEEGSVASLIDGWDADFVIGAGDNRYGSISYDTAVGQFFCNYMTDVTAGSNCSGGNSPTNTNAFFPAPGNHDYTDGGGINEYLSYFNLPGAGVETSGTSGNERYYDFVQGPVHVFAIDSQAARDSSTEMNAQKAWLQQAMASSTASWQVVLVHHAPYSSANHGSYPEMQWPYAAWGADAVIAGHDHVYERLSADGIPYFVNGLGGRSLYNFNSPLANSLVRYNGYYGAMRITANDTEITFEFLNTLGTIIDSYTVNAGEATDGIINKRIATGNDDVEERASDGVVDLNSSDMELGDDPEFNGEQTVGLRFQNLNIPQGATIDVAYLEFVVDETDLGDATNVEIRAQAADSAMAFTSSVNNLTNRSQTAAATQWIIPSWGTVGQTKQSPDITAMVQEVVARAGWTANNHMAFIISGTGSRTAEAFEGVPTAAPLLHVEWFSDTPVLNQAPTANAGADQTVPDTDGVGSESVTLDGSGSSDTDGSIVSYDWTWVGGSTSGINPTVNLPDGITVITLTVTDNEGATDTDIVTITVSSPVPQVPTAPSDLTAIDGANGTATLNWVDNSTNEDYFELERQSQNKKGNWRGTTIFSSNVSGDAGTASEHDSDPSGNGIFRYRVRAVSAAGASSWSNYAEVTVTGSSGGGGGSKPCRGKKCQ